MAQYGVRAQGHIYDRFKQDWFVEIRERDYTGLATVFAAGANPIVFRFGPGGDLDSSVKSTECIISLVQRRTDDYSWLYTEDDRKVLVDIRRIRTGLPYTTSVTPITIGTALLHITVDLDLLLLEVGETLNLIYDADNYIQGTVYSYDPLTGALTLQVTSSAGSGTYSDWDIFIEGEAESVYWYSGWLLPGQYIDDLSYIKQIELTFSDQLNLLSKKEYEYGGVGYTGKDTVLNQIARALNATGFAFGICVACNLFQHSMNREYNDDPLYQASVDQSIWMDSDFHPGMCGTVIEELLKALHCRIFQSQNIWWICSIRELRNAAIPYRRYTSGYVTDPIFVSNGILRPQVRTKHSNGTRNAKFMVTGGELSFGPAWAERSLEINYGLKNSLVSGLNVDEQWIDSTTHRSWSNEGDPKAWTHLNSGYLGFLKASTEDRDAIDSTKLLHSPALDIFAVNSYTFSVKCGRNKTPIFDPSCPVALVLHDPLGVNPDKCYNDRKAGTDPDDPDSYPWEAISEVFGPTHLATITFPKIDTDIIALRLVEKNIEIIAPPYDGELTIRFYAPYNNPSATNRPVLFYLGDVSFTRSNEATTLPDGEVTKCILNPNAFTVPENYAIKLNGGYVVRMNDEGVPVTIDTDRYLGMFTVANDETDLWSEYNLTDGYSAEFSLKEWIFINWYEQHYNPSRVYDGTFIGPAEMNSVIMIGEMNDALFLWDDVEYNVKSGIWEGKILELKDSAMDSSGVLIPPTSELKSGSLADPLVSITNINNPAVATAGAISELQMNKGSELGATTGITFDQDTGRILKGATAMCEYRSNVETTGSGEYTVIFLEPFLEGDDYSLPPVIWGKDINGGTTAAFPYWDSSIPPHIGFKINFGIVTTFEYKAIIKR